MRGAIDLGAKRVEYELTRSNRARYARLEIHLHRGARVILPAAAPAADAEKLLRSKSPWLLRHLARFDRLRTLVPDRKFKSGEPLPFLDEVLTLEVSRDAVRVERIGATISAPAKRTRFALEEWYVKQAALEFDSRVRAIALRHGIEIRGVRVSRGRSRWGSCSRNGRINLNWRLMLGPSSNLDYLIAHELAHVNHPNHSAAFWSRVAELHASYRDAERWLRKHGVGLVL